MSAQTDSMLATVHTEYGDVDTLATTHIPRPTPGKDEVLIRVKAAALNPADVLVMRGATPVLKLAFGLRKPRNPVRGTDAAGVVEAVGSEVPHWRPGDRVFGEAQGSLAQYAVARADRIARIPVNTTDEHAAASVMAGLAAIHALRRAKVGAGHRVLVIGAGGGIGSFAVQIAKASGAHVTGVCSAGKADAVRAIGADAVLDYAAEVVTDLPGDYQLVLDNAGAVPMLDLVPLVSATGVVIPNSGQPGPDGGPFTRVLRAMWRSKVRRLPIDTYLSTTHKSDLEEIARMLADGAITPLMDTLFTLDQASAAMARVASHHAWGKVVVTVP